MKKLSLKSAGGVIENVPAKEAIRRGLARPAYRSGSARIPVSPVGMGVFAKYSVGILDADGRPVRVPHPKTGKRVTLVEAPSHSFTRNFAQLIRGFLQNVDGVGTLNINETLTDDAGATFQCRLKGGSASTGTIAVVSGACKVKFGNSTAALSTTQFNLQGTLLGTTTEAACTINLTVEDSANTVFTVQGQITNTTGSSFTVEEVGLFSELGSIGGAANNTTMVLRDLTGTFNVANNQTIIATYTFTIAV